MKLKPRVVSKKAKAPAGAFTFTVLAPSTKDGANVAVAARLAGATGVPGLHAGGAIAKVESRHPLGYAAGSGASSGRAFTFVDGGNASGVGKGQAWAGGVLGLTGAFTPGKIGSNGTVLAGDVVGYVTSATGVFGSAGLTAGSPFTARLDSVGARWRVVVAPRG
jgi:hypothetical protein